MCLPVMAAAGTIMNVISAKQNADAQSEAYQSQANIAKQNSLYNQAQAANASYNGAQAEQQIALKRQQVTGTQRADYGASGVDPNSGSALSVQNSSIMQSLADQIQTRQNAVNEVWGYQTESVANQNLANDYKAAANNAQTVGKFNMASSLLNGATSLSSMYGQYEQTGSNQNFWTSNWGTGNNSFSSGLSYTPHTNTSLGYNQNYGAFTTRKKYNTIGV